ncbi:hypothetical protein [Leeuwenhoekiella sp. H156]|uniref:hypothetical protein n=1 Tax=Leeuwenhoekiella sp. H156 TaxID=3450128 RepID=UPI003FA4AEDF
MKITVLLFFYALSFTAFSQTDGVGIGTTQPRAKLEVAGDAKISQGISIGVIDNLEDADTSTFLIQESSDQIKSLDVSNPTGAALGYIQVYEIYNPNEDWVLDFDTGIDANDFVLNTLSASYDRELDIDNNATIPYYSAFINNGTWHITADFPAANNLYPSELGTWTITTLIYSKDLSKQFGNVVIDMSGGSTGTATNPIIN